MPLRIELKPNERLIINGALIRNGDRRSVFMIENQCKFLRESEIIFEAEADTERVRVAIVDHGVGIPAAQRARVFERFFRVDAPDRSGIHGTGLGLALVRDIVEAHGGEVGVESVEGEGSRFWVSLPVAV